MSLLADNCDDRAEQLLALSERLITLLDQETLAFNRRGGTFPANLSDEKTRLANTYRLELARIAQDKSLISGAASGTRLALEQATGRLQESVKENARAVLRLKTVSEGMVKAIGDEIANARKSPVGYGPYMGAKQPRASATAVTLNRVA